MAEAERPDHQPGHDLVADAEQQRRVEHLVRERHRGRERDDVAAEQRELHPGTALGDAVAHRRHAAGELRDAAGAQDLLLEQRRVALERLVRREHVVVGGDDRDVRDLLAREQILLLGPARGHAVREVRAAGVRSRPALALFLLDPAIDPVEVRAAWSSGCGGRSDR